MNKRLCMLCFALVAAAGCSDEAVEANQGQSKKEAGGACEMSKDCVDGLTCDEGVCVTLVKLGEDCSGEWVVCRKGECEDGICVDKSEEPECGPDKDCPSGQVCENGSCVEKAPEPECGPGKDCLGDQVCKDGKCEAPAVEPEPVEPEPAVCSEELPCEAPLKCAQDGFCHEPAAPGGECSRSMPCPDGQFCGVLGVCIDLQGPGGECMYDDNCLGEAVCNGVCMLVDQEIGAQCEEFVTCKSGLSCLEGVCKKPVKAEEDCDANHVCPDGTVCFESGGRTKCTVSKGGCKDDAECGADSYCCTDEACSVKNFCVPYGEGPRGDLNTGCGYKTVPGLFEAAIQCEWKSPAQGDPYPSHDNVLMTPLVMDTPHDSGTAQEIIFTTYNNGDGGAPSGQGSDIRYYGVIRIINGENCALQESIFDDANHIIGGSNIAMADVDKDGFVEIFAGRGSAQHANNGGGLVAFHWDDAQQKYVTWWATTQHSGSTTNWGGPAIHDINNDGIPEIIGYGGEVFSTLDGKRLNPGQTIAELYYTPTLGDLDKDGNVEIIGTVNTYRWDSAQNLWVKAYSKATSTGIHPAFADFGTRNPDGTFNPNMLDGRAEIVNCGSGIVQIATLEGENVLRVTGLKGGGPCTVGDFDGDGFPEVATAFGDSYRIFDPRCKSAEDGCSSAYILWGKLSQDASSSSTGSSLFDFDGDGAMEAVYADECYTRVYDGKTGDVLFSAYHSSATWHEYPVIADVDNDESAEIVVGSNNRMSCQSPDPIHRGLRCATDGDCKSGVCRAGLCRCTSNDQCNWRVDQNGVLLNEYGCVGTLTADDQPAEGNVCRAIRSNAERVTGVRVMKDSLDRWMSSRNIWNQHAYSITNISDDQTVPTTAQWLQNFTVTGLNNFRQNKQGLTGANRAPDITGRFVGEACGRTGDKVVLGAEICNRGTKMVAALMPASFYQLGKDENDNETRAHLCTSYTSANVPVGGCLHVSCEIDDVIQGDIVLVANDDGQGGRTTVECNEKNNEDRTTIKDCPVIVN